MKMDRSRRQFVLAGLGLVAAGCGSDKLADITPGPTWPGPRRRPQPDWKTVSLPEPPPPSTAGRPRALAGMVQVGPLHVIPRARWAKFGPIRSRLNPMGPIRRITIHHEGHKAVWFTDWASSAQRMDTIRRWHLQRRFGDIGYHLVVDRAGRVWQGRDIRYQGAHVSKNNEQNLGMMVLGHFDRQAPTSAQLKTVNDILPRLMSHFGVSKKRIYTHRELMPTTCPGKRLQWHMASLRRGRALG